jgi:cellular nucleic acid-binding protein
MASTMPSNPYPTLRDTQPFNTVCELCDRTIQTKDWQSHKNSKGHRKLEEAVRSKENVRNNEAAEGDENSGGKSNAFSAPDAWGSGGFGTSTTDDTGFDDGDGGIGGNMRKFKGACYGCGEEGHSKRDCPKSGGGRACFNCGQAGYVSLLLTCSTTTNICVRHNKVDCPNPRQGGGSGSDRACYNCGQVG